MARLTRKNIKVFAGNATNNGVFGSLQAENPVTTNNVEQIQSLPAWGNGWNSATVTSDMLPPLEEFQGVQYVTTYQQAYIMQEGLPEWAASVTYYKGSLVKEVTANGFKIYNSLTDDNTNNLLSDTSNWVKVMDSTDLYAFDNEVVHLTGDETITGAKTFSSAVTFANGTWNVVGDDAYIGDADMAGAVCIKGNNAQSKLALFDRNSSYSNGFYIDETDSNALKVQDQTKGMYWGAVTSLVAQNLSGNGYVKFSNGLIIQWGSVTAQNVVLTITLPTSFASTNYTVAGTTHGYGKALFISNDTKTTTNFKLDLGGGIGTAKIDWIAIGY